MISRNNENGVDSCVIKKRKEAEGHCEMRNKEESRDNIHVSEDKTIEECRSVLNWKLSSVGAKESKSVTGKEYNWSSVNVEKNI